MTHLTAVNYNRVTLAGRKIPPRPGRGLAGLHGAGGWPRPGRELRPHRLIPSAASGLFTGLLEVLFVVSFASLIFAGDLAPFLAQSIGFILLGSVLLGLVIAFFTSLPGTVGGTQDVAAAVLAVIAASVARTMPAGPGRAGFSHPGLIKLFPSLDRGLEWCETQLLQASVDQEAEDATQPLQQELAAVLGSAHTAQRLLAYLESRPVKAGEYLIRQGEEAYEMYFVESGQLTAQIEVAGQEPRSLCGCRRCVGGMWWVSWRFSCSSRAPRLWLPTS